MFQTMLRYCLQHLNLQRMNEYASFLNSYMSVLFLDSYSFDPVHLYKLFVHSANVNTYSCSTIDTPECLTGKYRRFTRKLRTNYAKNLRELRRQFSAILDVY